MDEVQSAEDGSVCAFAAAEGLGVWLTAPDGAIAIVLQNPSSPQPALPHSLTSVGATVFEAQKYELLLIHRC